jgi:osmotically-inducible protein OsmY
MNTSIRGRRRHGRVVSSFRFCPIKASFPIVCSGATDAEGLSSESSLMEKTMSQDTQLQQAVQDEFAWEPSVTPAHIGVTANAGVVTLTGHVDSYAGKFAAESAARRVKGVKAVAEEIEVRLPFEHRRGDDEIAAAAIERLMWNASIPRDSIKVKVEKGWGTLTGQVDWWYQQQAVQQDIRPLLGVVGVSNQTTIRARVDTVNLSEDITHALHRSWFFDPTEVHVSANGGRVKLTGTVHSDHERQVAATTAWSAPGATSVENDLAVA